MSEPTKTPGIFQHLQARDRGILLKQQKLRQEEEEEATSAIMSDEQTYAYFAPEVIKAVKLISQYSFIAIKPDGVQV